MSVSEVFSALLETVYRYPLSLYGTVKAKHVFKDLKTYCMFLGCRRSGKTLIASLLDAHPDMIVADELGALRYVHAGFSRKQIWYLLLKKSRLFAQQGRISKGYSFSVPGQWQGQLRNLLVIGDNKGHGAVLRLQARPWLLDRLYRVMGIKVKIFHVIRNPYDTISSLAERMDNTIAESIEVYFALCEAIVDVKKQLDIDGLFEIKYEKLLADPKNVLERICGFLGVDAPVDYLNDCAGIVITSPCKTRYNVQWDNDLLTIVEKNCARFDFLDGYSYHD